MVDVGVQRGEHDVFRIISTFQIAERNAVLEVTLQSEFDWL